MIIEPKIRGFLCTTAHPEGCRASVEEQIRHVKKGGPIGGGAGGPKRALILGCST
jgi:enoyl-[acyl-carrier protein] reductase/trans-2-enoyl-CoA reductase (NAD+)